MKYICLSLLIFGILPFCCSAAKADDYTRKQVQETYEIINRNIVTACKLCTQNPAPHVMVEILKKNDAVCKNVLAVSNAPADFKKAFYSYVDKARFAIAIIVLRNKNSQQYTAEEVKFLKDWEQQRLKVIQLAKKYGFTPPETETFP